MPRLSPSPYWGYPRIKHVSAHNVGVPELLVAAGGWCSKHHTGVLLKRYVLMLLLWPVLPTPHTPHCLPQSLFLILSTLSNNHTHNKKANAKYFLGGFG